MNAREKFTKGLIGASGHDGLGPQVRNRVRVQCHEDESREEVTFRTLLDGKLLKPQIYANCDGFSRRSMTFAYATESLDDGIAYVKVTSPRVWMVPHREAHRSQRQGFRPYIA